MTNNTFSLKNLLSGGNKKHSLRQHYLDQVHGRIQEDSSQPSFAKLPKNIMAHSFYFSKELHHCISSKLCLAKNSFASLNTPELNHPPLLALKGEG